MRDRIPDPCRLLVVGINPGRLSDAHDAPFAHPGNRFWPALERAGITPYRVDATGGLSEQDAAMLAERGIGFTNFVDRMTPRAADLKREELVAGGERVRRCVEKHKPSAVMVVGIGAYRDAYRRPRATRGLQPERLGGAPVWVVGNPSGLNAHETVDTLAESYREVWEASVGK
ncbi:mismatch-specific DNA-glycosylase [Corynebacterium sp. HMSC074A01]|uniref:mismatch-specific DNA-glycosylase n=1 Tax=Corynebacterium sp. HMSC074A01 TaxID=1715030 RepID=UPI0008A24A00|nr:mismatch-specific DNA-glycosylase [Corynebacterium sp. HMSC074A01]OHF35806.1 mismatch-specific DNA-glycosylase [Corynebacterium sp. HMSC074A01]